MANVVYTFNEKAGEYLMGLPGRDLTDDDLAALTPEQRADLDGYVAAGGKAYRPSKELRAALKEQAPPSPGGNPPAAQ